MDIQDLSTVLYTADQARDMDRLAQQDIGISGYELMRRAGSAAWNTLRKHWHNARRILVCAGMGNNAGDGLVLARLAAQAGYEVRIHTLGDTSKLQGDARRAFDDMPHQSLHCQCWTAEMEFPTDADTVLVDALFGTGLNRDLDGKAAQMVAAINASGLPVMALDIPSGLDADSGQARGVAIHAAVTLSFIGVKRGLLTGQAADYVGKLEYAGLDIPASIHQAVSGERAQCIRLTDFQPLLRPRRRTLHKGQCGHVLVVGGAPGYAGAALMAATAALRCGAGLVSVATHPAHAASFSTHRPELMVHGISEDRQLPPLLRRATTVLAGPGLGQSDWAQTLLSHVLDMAQALVLDADALNILSANPDTRIASEPILTPHPGEAARLLGNDTTTVQADRFRAVTELQQRFGGVAVLKGSGTLIRAPDGWLALCPDGNPGMASGGMGDVLGGVIAALLAQGLSPRQAAGCGVCLHAAAADMAAANGERGMLAMDLMDCLRRLANPRVAG